MLSWDPNGQGHSCGFPIAPHPPPTHTHAHTHSVEAGLSKKEWVKEKKRREKETHTHKRGGYEGQNSKVRNSTNNPFHSKGWMTNTHTTSKDPRLAGLACCSGLFLQQTQGQLRVSREQSKHDGLISGQQGSYKEGGHSDISFCSPT